MCLETFGRARAHQVKTYKDFVSVVIEQAREHFSDSLGRWVISQWATWLPAMVRPIITDANAFGQEWQLRDTEPSLFRPFVSPASGVCTMPTPMQFVAPSPSLGNVIG
jgi:hypothetical protein